VRSALRGAADLTQALVSPHPVKRLKSIREEKHLERMILDSPYFLPIWYSSMYPEVRRAGYRPSLHYVRFGALQRRQPSPNFDAVWYLDTYEDVAASGINPLIHYIQFGEREGRRRRMIPESLMDERFRSWGLIEASAKEIRLSGYFDQKWYQEKYAKVLGKDTDLALDYLLHGAYSGRDPGPHFSSSYYLEANADIREAGDNPLLHFEKHGRTEGRPFAVSRQI
jgi:hypothetical protein